MILNVYRVQLAGQNIKIRIDGSEVLCGFVKNEYVRAFTEKAAIEKAMRRVLVKLEKNRNVHFIDESSLQLSIDEIESGVSLWKLIKDEGFVFFVI